jgi:hypothetical protein
LFGQFEYVQATKEYLSLVEDGNTDSFINSLVIVIFNMANTVEAEKWYAKAIMGKTRCGSIL